MRYHQHMASYARIVPLLILTWLGAACNRLPSSREAPEAAELRPHYVVTVLPLALILREVCGERAEITTLLKAGASSHTFDPTPSDAQRIQEATAFFWIGQEFDGWAAEFDTSHSVQVLKLIPQENLIDLAVHGEWDDHALEPEAGKAPDHEQDSQGHAGHGHEHEVHHDAHHEHGEHSQPVPDPHFACDPLTVRALLPALTARLSELHPAGRPEYERRAAAFSTKLTQLDAELQAQLAPFKGKPVILFHPSFNYFLRRYGLRYAGVIEPFPGKEPSPKYLQGIVRKVKAEQAKAIFSETLLPAAPAAVIGEAAGVPVVELDPSCGNSGHAYSDYFDWVRYNAALFSEAL
jgi:zinc transport system substrate-binding protein